MEREFDALEAACKRGDSFAVLKPQLVKYVVALEEARFLDAGARSARSRGIRGREGSLIESNP